MSLRLSSLRNSVYMLESELRHAKENNERLQSAKEKYSEAYSIYSSMDEYYKNLKSMNVLMTVALNKYRSNAIKVLEQEIANCLKLVFPEEDYNVRIDWKTNSGSGEPSAVMMIGKRMPDGTYDYMPPSLQNGGLAKQLISFSAVSSILAMLGCKCIFVDEAFNSGDGRSLQELAPLLMSLLDKGIQITGIEHKMQVFDGLPRRVFDLQKNRITGSVSIVETNDYNMDDLKEVSKLAQGLEELEPDAKEDTVDTIDDWLLTN